MILLGALIGLCAATGALTAIFAAPPLRRQRLPERIAPYLLDDAAPSRLLGSQDPGPVTTLGRLTQPLISDLVRFLDKVVGGQSSVRKRLAALRSATTVEQFRAEQILWGVFGLGIGLLFAFAAVVTGHRNLVLLALIVGGSLIGGILARDWWLSESVSRRHHEMLAEFPVIAEMLALAVAAGEGVLGAIGRITALTHGHLSRELAAILADSRSGAPLQQALKTARDNSQLEALSRFLDGMAVAVERGTPMAEVLHAQAADVRALSKRELLESGGKKEIMMMVPVVFIILPITILFAFFPGFIAITTVAG